MPRGAAVDVSPTSNVRTRCVPSAAANVEIEQFTRALYDAREVARCATIT